MSVHVEEMTTSVETAAAAVSHSTETGASASPGQRERARRAAERAARLANRTRSEGYDD
jgi:hypothetical protein